MPQPSFLPESSRNLLFAFLVLGILCLVLSAYVMEHGSASGHLVRDLGIAVLVGVFVSITIERVSRERQEQEVAAFLRTIGENFIYAVYGNDFPRDLFDCVRETVFGTKLLRTDYQVRGWLHDIDDKLLASATPEMESVLSSVLDESDRNAGLVVFHCTSEYKVRNVSAQPACYQLVFRVDGPFDKKKRGLAAIVSVLIDGNQQLPVAPLYFKEDRTRVEFPDVRFEKAVDIHPGEAIKVEIETYMVRRSYDEEGWVSLVPTEGMTVEIHDENGNKEVQVDLSAPLFGKSQGVTRALKNDKTNKARLEVRQYLLPYQGVKIKWSPRSGTEAIGRAA